MKSITKRLNSLLLAFIVFCGTLTAGLSAPPKAPRKAYADNWYDVLSGSETSYSGSGDGLVTNPFLIESAEQLALISYLVNNSGAIPNTVTNSANVNIPFNQAFYKLIDDIDLNGRAFIPIGTGSFTDKFNDDNVSFANTDNVFMGHFNGGNFKITGLTGGALFGAADSAYIRNFDLTDVEITASGHCGAVVNAAVDTEVRNVGVSGSVSSDGAVGGIMGYGARSSVFACENYADITSGAGTDDYAGGLAGAMVKGGLGDCINEGGVAGFNAGGIMGYGMQASINRTINAGTVISAGGPSGQFTGVFNTVNAGVASTDHERIYEAGALIKDSFYYGNTLPIMKKTDGGLIGANTNSALSYIRVKGLDYACMSGRMQQKLNMSDWKEDGDGAPDLLFKKWWEYNDNGLPRPIRWEMWADSAKNDINSYTLPEKLAYYAYMWNRGLWSESDQQSISLSTTYQAPLYYHGNIDLQGKLWTPFGTVKHPYMGATFSGVTATTGVQSFISNMTINSALSYQSFFGVVKQRSDAGSPVLKVNRVHLAGMDVWGASADMTAGFVSLYIYHNLSGTQRSYLFSSCNASGFAEAYGHAAGLTAGSADLIISAPIIYQSGNAADITSFSGDACGIVFNWSNIVSTSSLGFNNSFNTGTISAVRQNGVASGLISYVNAANSMSINLCYNSGGLKAGAGGVKANYAGNIQGAAACTFENCFYRNDISGAYAAYRTGSGPVNTGIGNPLPLESMQGTGMNLPSAMVAAGLTSNWTLWEGCNNSCPVLSSSLVFFNVNVKYEKHDGDVIIGAKIISLKPQNTEFECQKSVLKAYPVRGIASDFNKWENTIRPDETTIEYIVDANDMSKNVTAYFEPMSSVTIASYNPDGASIDVSARETGASTQVFPAYTVDNGKIYMHTYIFPIEDASSNPVSFSLTANGVQDYPFEGWYDYDKDDKPIYDGSALKNPLEIEFAAEVKDVLFRVFVKFESELPQYIIIAAITITVGRAAGGRAAGAGNYSEGDIATLRAFADEGYRFTGWYDGAGNFVSGGAEYSFTVSRSEKFTPLFEKDRKAATAVTVLFVLGGTLLLLSLGLLIGLFVLRRKNR